MKKDRIVRDAERVLNSSGYATVLANNMHTCADVIAEHKGRKFIIKVVHNIDSVKRSEANALFKLAQFLDAEPIILGSVSGSKRMKENVSRYRFDVRCITADTLPGLIHGDTSLLASRSFGAKTLLDGARLRSLRKMSGMRIMDLASRTGLSRSTLYKHEEGANYAAVSTVQKLEKILNGYFGAEQEPPHVTQKLRVESFARTGMQALELHTGPFDIVAKKRNYYEISLDANSRTLVKRAELFRAIRDTFENNYPFIMSEKKAGRMHGVPVVRKKDVLGAASEDELMELVY